MLRWVKPWRWSKRLTGSRYQEYRTVFASRNNRPGGTVVTGSDLFNKAVRALSQRSSQAAKDIAALINKPVERTGVGSKLVAEVEQSMESIVNSVARVNDIMEEIASASEEQSRGIEQISHAITELGSTTQQNATLVSASSSSANTLEEQAIVLTQLMATFRLGDTQTAPPSRLARPSTQALPAKAPVAGNAQNWTHF